MTIMHNKDYYCTGKFSKKGYFSRKWPEGCPASTKLVQRTLYKVKSSKVDTRLLCNGKDNNHRLSMGNIHFTTRATEADIGGQRARPPFLGKHLFADIGNH